MSEKGKGLIKILEALDRLERADLRNYTDTAYDVEGKAKKAIKIASDTILNEAVLMSYLSEEVEKLKAKIFVYEEIIKKTNFAPLVIEEKEEAR